MHLRIIYYDVQMHLCRLFPIIAVLYLLAGNAFAGDKKKHAPQSQANHAAAPECDHPEFPDIGKCRLQKEEYVIGRAYHCVDGRAACLNRCEVDEHGSVNRACRSGCHRFFEACKKKQAEAAKFNCHDFAYEGCRWMRMHNHKAWIVAWDDRKDAAGHTDVVFLYKDKDGDTVACVWNPQETIAEVFDGRFCWTPVTFNGNKPSIPDHVMNEIQLEKFSPKSYGYYDCDANFFEARGELPWHKCGTEDRDPNHFLDTCTDHWISCIEQCPLETHPSRPKGPAHIQKHCKGICENNYRACQKRKGKGGK